MDNGGLTNVGNLGWPKQEDVLKFVELMKHSTASLKVWRRDHYYSVMECPLFELLDMYRAGSFLCAECQPAENGKFLFRLASMEKPVSFIQGQKFIIEIDLQGE